MNPPPPDAVNEGLRAYEQVRAFEAVQQRRLPLIYGALELMLLAAAAAMFRINRPAMAYVCLVTALVFGCIAFLNWRRLQGRHAANLRLLADLERRYGNQLPWIQVEEHFAALEKLQAELRQEEEEAGR